MMSTQVEYVEPYLQDVFMGRKKKRKRRIQEKQGQGINLEIVMWDADTPNIQQLKSLLHFPLRQR